MPASIALETDSTATCAEVSPPNQEPILPLALREVELTEADVATLLRVAQDKNAASGRYKRQPKRIPTA